MHSISHVRQQLTFVLFPCLIVATSLGQNSSIKNLGATASHTTVSVKELSLEDREQGCGMAPGSDGMLYILKCHHAGRYDKGTLSKLNPEAFSRLPRGKDGRYHASPEDLTEVYVFGRPGEPSASFDPESMIAGADGKLYISGYWEHCARFDPKTQNMEWIKYGPDRMIQPRITCGIRTMTLFNIPSKHCFAATADGLMWCGNSNEGSAG